MPPSHDISEINVRVFLAKHRPDLKIERKWVQYFDEPFIAYHQLRKSKQRTFFGHEYDLVAYTPMGIIEYVIELGNKGDDSKHQYKTPFAPNKGQQINDGVAEDWIATRLPLAKFVRINKDDTYHEAKLTKVFQ